MTPIVPVVLAGGTGTRLWPLSRMHHPKQLWPLFGGDRTLLQQTALRFSERGGFAAPTVITDEALRFLVAEQLRGAGVKPGTILLEGDPRGTAPALAVAALHATGTGADPLMLVLPSDHAVEDPIALRDTIEAARNEAESGAIVAFGVTPRSPEPEFGYIEPAAADGGARPIAGFAERPTRVAAAYFVEQGWLWNSGILLARASRLLEELDRAVTGLVSACRKALDAGRADLDFLRLDGDAWSDVPRGSADALLLSDRAVVLHLDCGWADINSYAALHAASHPDGDGNVVRGDVFVHGTRDTFVHAEHRLVATVGLRDAIVVETADAVVVADRSKAEDVGAIVDRLLKAEREEAWLHRRVARPWGTYEGVDRGARYQVKRITVKPGASLSLQMHHRRAEHWIVVSGVATVTRGDDVFDLHENESTFIPLGTKHRLENRGAEVLELIEVQSGDYLGEDDIVRFEDKYGR